MFLRFETHGRHAETGLKVGVFHVAYELLESDHLESLERREIRLVLDWFAEHLPIPHRLACSRRPGAHSNGVCWFKSTAARHVSQVRYLAILLRQQQIAVVEKRTVNPGYIAFEDDFQVVAEPFAETRRR